MNTRKIEQDRKPGEGIPLQDFTLLGIKPNKNGALKSPNRAKEE